MDELRRVLFRVLGVWFVLAVGYFIAMPWLFDNVVLAPVTMTSFSTTCCAMWEKFSISMMISSHRISNVKLININLAALFFIHMSTAFWMSVVTATPYIFLKSGGLSVLRSMLMSGVA